MMSEPSSRAASILRRIFLGIIGFCCVFPLLFLALQSVGGRWDYPHIFPQSFNANSWRVIFSAGQLGQSLLLSLGISTSVGVCATIAGFLTSKYIAYHRRRRTLLYLAYVPFVMSPVIFGVCILFLFIKLRIADHLLGVIVGQGIIAYGFAIVFFARFWNAELRAMEDMVYTLGGDTWTAFRCVLIPVARGTLLVCFCQTFLISWFDYALALIVGGGKIGTLTIRLFGFITEANMQLAAVSGLFLIAPPIALFWLNRRFLLKPV